MKQKMKNTKTHLRYNSYPLIDGFKKARNIVFILLALSLASSQSIAQSYPFVLPNNITATLVVDTTQKEAFKNQLLGYNIEGFSTNLQKDFFRKFDPISVRFPHGVWANFYKWQTDGYQNDSYDNEGHEAALATYVNSISGHIDHIASLNTERKNEKGSGFHMMWTYAMNFDDAESCVARAHKDLGLGLEVKDIELGNEHFWKNQRSNQTITAEDYLSRAKSVADALHDEFPDVRVSIPLGWRRNQGGYNRTIAGDQKYYDAITVHKYMGADPDIPGESNSAYSALLTARTALADDINWIRSNCGEKPIWLTEWGVSAGSGAEVNSAACLGMADVFLYMSENQHIYDRANWFSFNRMLNSMVYVTIENKREPVYPLQRRGYLSAYEMIHDVLLDAVMLKSSMTTANVDGGLGSMNVVNSRIVEKDGVTTAVAVNLSNKPVNFVIKFGETTYEGTFKHEALVFDELGNVPNMSADLIPYELIKSGVGTITLPPLSINKIALGGEVTNPTNYIFFNNLIDGAVIEPGSNLNITASAGSEIAKVDLFVNNVLVRTINGGPYEWGIEDQNDLLLSDLQIGIYNLKLVATDALSATTESIISIEVKDLFSQSPFDGLIQIPGTLEAENYDVGGEGISYHDTDVENKGNMYRNDGVDIGSFSDGLFNIGWSANDEWLEYSIRVEETEVYDVDVVYSAGRGTPAAVGLELIDEDIVLFNNFSLPATANWDAYTSIRKEGLQLTEGEHSLRLNISMSGCNIDKLIFSKSGTTSINDLKIFGLKVFPNPSADGHFNLSEIQTWEVFSIEGVKVLEGKGREINMTPFNKGMYILKTESVFLKLIKK